MNKGGLLSGLKRFEQYKSLPGFTKASSSSRLNSDNITSGRFANLKLTAEKLVKEQASVKTYLEIANTKLKKSTEDMRVLQEKLQHAFNDNAKHKVKQKEDEKLWKGLESKFSSTKTLCDQLTETLQYLAGQVQDAEKEKKFFEEKLSANLLAIDDLTHKMNDLSLKLEEANETIKNGKEEMKKLRIKKEGQEELYRVEQHKTGSIINEKDFTIKQLEGSVAAGFSELNHVNSRLTEVQLVLISKEDEMKCLKRSLENLEKEKTDLQSSNEDFSRKVVSSLTEIKHLNGLVQLYAAKLTDLDEQSLNLSEKLVKLNSVYESYIMLAQEEMELAANIMMIISYRYNAVKIGSTITLSYFDGGLVLASDSQETDPEGNITYGKKIFVHDNMVLATAGLVNEKVEKLFHSLEKMPLCLAADKLKDCWQKLATSSLRKLMKKRPKSSFDLRCSEFIIAGDENGGVAAYNIACNYDQRKRATYFLSTRILYRTVTMGCGGPSARKYLRPMRNENSASLNSLFSIVYASVDPRNFTGGAISSVTLYPNKSPVSKTLLTASEALEMKSMFKGSSRGRSSSFGSRRGGRSSDLAPWRDQRSTGLVPVDSEDDDEDAETGLGAAKEVTDQCSISALTLKAVKDAGYEKKTMVQEATLPVILKGKDVLAQAKTGTAKTVAILSPEGFATRMMGVKVLILDEADHLLDMGFRRDIERIIVAVPKQHQTLLFSATVPEEVRQICHVALKRDHEYINAVQEGSEDTHAQVKQMHLVAPLGKHFSLLYALLKEHISDDVDYKVLVFCTTAMVTKLVASLLGELNMNVQEIHSRKPRSYRTRVSDEFRKSKGSHTSDV